MNNYKLESKNILLISPQKWTDLFVSKHHYASELQKKNNVYFVNPPSGVPLKVNSTLFDNIKTIDYNYFPIGLKYYPNFIKRIIFKRVIKKIESKVNVNIDIVWSFDDSVFYMLDSFSTFTILHIVDLNQNFNIKSAASTAEICIGLTDRLCEKLRKYNKKTLQLGHGVQEKPIVIKKNDIISGKNPIKALYAGNLDMPHIDWELTDYLVTKHEHVDFIFIGTISSQSKIISHIFSQENVYYLGERNSKELFNYYSCADILLITYREEYFENYASPHKMMEYLASGRFILSTWIEEYSSLHDLDLIKMSRSANNFVNNFEKVIRDLKYYNSSIMSKKRIEFTKDNTYEKQVKKIEKFINKNYQSFN